MFQSRTGALAFVGLTLIGAAAMVGSEDQAGTIETATSEIFEQRKAFDAQAEAMGTPDPSPVLQVVEASSSAAPVPAENAALVLDPKGIDPTPIVPEPIDAAQIEQEKSEPGQGEAEPSELTR